ncbi:MAG TPA: hypothetical protein PLI09_14525 [Candidatus Hydrogenedentes bacterium]|nr:hypothetical protein [Candidatus Hydrogenedentota bacterium]
MVAKQCKHYFCIICIIFLLSLLPVLPAGAESRVTFSLRNVWMEEGVYRAELWARVSASGWSVGTSVITVQADETALNPAPYHYLEAMDAYYAISGFGNYNDLVQLDLGGNDTAMLILHQGGAYHTFPAGNYHLATFRWDVIDPSVSDQLAFDYFNCTIRHETTVLSYNVADDTGYTPLQPDPQTIGAPHITVQPEITVVDVCDGARLEVPLGIAGAAPLSVYWEHSEDPGDPTSWHDVTGQSGTPLVLDPVKASDSGYYRAIVHNAYGSDTSDIVFFGVQVAPQVIIPLIDESTCAGEDVTFTVEYDVTNGAVFWQVYNPVTELWDTIDSGDNRTYTFTNVQPETHDGLQIRTYAGNGCFTTFSGPVTLSVAYPFTLASEPADKEAVIGDLVEFDVALDPDIPAQYLWEVDRGMGFSILSAETSPALSLAQVFPSDAGRYRCTVSNACTTLATREAVLTIAPNDNHECSDDAVFSQPPASPRFAFEIPSNGDDYHRPHESFSGLTAPIGRIRWWGINTQYDEFLMQAVPCDRDPDTFRIDFYENDSGAPGEILQAYQIEPMRMETGQFFSSFPVIRYEAVLEPPLSITEGWISIFGVIDVSCRFHWIGSPIGDGTMYMPVNGGHKEIPDFDMSLCMAPVMSQEGEEGLLEGDIEGIVEGQPEGIIEGAPDGEGVVEGQPEGEGFAEGALEGAIEGQLEGEGVEEGTEEGEAEGQIEGSAEGGSEGQEEGEGGEEGVVEGESEGMLSEGSLEEGEGVVVEGETEGQVEGMPEGMTSEGSPEEGSAEGGSEGEVYGGIHSADSNGDGLISLSELLRVIQFFNSDGFHCEAGTEDGYAPGPGDTSCAPYDSDYNAQDWHISLSELLRVIQFFNSGGYHYCPGEGTEDEFCPGS